MRIVLILTFEHSPIIMGHSESAAKCRSSRERTVHRMARHNRYLALAIAIATLFIVLTSAYFIAAEAGHNCIGDGCQICCLVNACRAVLKGLALVIVAAVLAAVVCFALFYLLAACRKQARSCTLISLKVKLSD